MFGYPNLYQQREKLTGRNIRIYIYQNEIDPKGNPGLLSNYLRALPRPAVTSLQHQKLLEVYLTLAEIDHGASNSSKRHAVCEEFLRRSSVETTQEIPCSPIISNKESEERGERERERERRMVSIQAEPN